MSLIDRLIKTSPSEYASRLKKSEFYSDDIEKVQMDVPILNVALSGRLDGGLGAGILMLAGPSKHFKTLFGLMMAAAYLKKYPEAVLILYISEFGTPKSYFKTVGIDEDRVVFIPVSTVEELTHDLVKQLNEIKKEDKVVVLVDSVGNLASIKETDDALAGKDTVDMTRSKRLKSFSRLVTTPANMLEVPIILINHTYDTMDQYSPQKIGGGSGLYLASDNVWILGRQQDKDKTSKELKGYKFIINVDKSRHLKEKSKFPVVVSFDDGVKKYSGLLEIAVAGGYVGKPNKQKYQLIENGEFVGDTYKEKELLDNSKFWNHLILDTDFPEFVKKMFLYKEQSLVAEQDNYDEIIEYIDEQDN